ncbi:amidohydrolase [Sphingomonas sp. LaA6.9]|uniref:amidohydrolase n=1 Tax=Sphingomonas sp. LaA6.9 TaxID=2919914 RepID=UPI001F4F8CED|nr:amidohydrolase [Sphingomonas sp. LaA6.9]MCJ8156504.1 amidohydrolase [Sphingomonas sp. LaA6.9]
MRLGYLLLAAACVSAPALAQPDYAPAVEADYKASLGALFDYFHRNPELGFLESKTAARMAAELKKAGATVTEGIGKTGVVAVMKNGDGPVVMIRADMDGLPVEEKSGLANASKARQVNLAGEEVPVMHACGHDVHITSMVGTAKRLAAMKDRWKGTVVFVVQPAEEPISGAKAMIADGIYTRFPKPDYALALHVSSGLGTGKVSASEGIQYSSADSLEILVRGVGTHGASPHMGKDPVYIGSQIVVALQSIVSREVMPLSPAVITVGSFHAGTRPNIISDQAKLEITVRANDEETRAQLIKAVERVARGVARTHGLPEDKLPEVRHVEGTPTTINDGALARRLNAVMVETLGKDGFEPFVQDGMGAEDFAYFIEKQYGVPGYYFAVGGTPQAAFDAEKAGGPPVPGHHSPLFRIDPEPSVTTGTVAMTAAVLELMKPGAAGETD